MAPITAEVLSGLVPGLGDVAFAPLIHHRMSPTCRRPAAFSTFP